MTKKEEDSEVKYIASGNFVAGGWTNYTRVL